MRTYRQYCPIARGAEVFAERWTPVIVRNLAVGCASADEILEGAPGLSRSLLDERLTLFEELGIVSSTPGLEPDARFYELTPSGRDMVKVCMTLGEWGAAHLELGPEHLDPFVALWVMTRTFRWERVPARRVVVRFDFTGDRSGTYWMTIELGDSKVHRSDPGLDEDLVVTADAEAFVRYRDGHLAWAEVVGDGRIALEGPADLVEGFPTWAPDAFGHVERSQSSASRP